MRRSSHDICPHFVFRADLFAGLDLKTRQKRGHTAHSLRRSSIKQNNPTQSGEHHIQATIHDSLATCCRTVSGMIAKSYLYMYKFIYSLVSVFRSDSCCFCSGYMCGCSLQNLYVHLLGSAFCDSLFVTHNLTA